MSKELSDAAYIIKTHVEASRAQLRDCFYKILCEHGKLTKLGMAKGRVSNIKNRIDKKGWWPNEDLMREYLLLAGYAHTPEKWEKV